jgi:hypothetical protein
LDFGLLGFGPVGVGGGRGHGFAVWGFIGRFFIENIAVLHILNRPCLFFLLHQFGVVDEFAFPLLLRVLLLAESTEGGLEGDVVALAGVALPLPADLLLEVSLLGLRIFQFFVLFWFLLVGDQLVQLIELVF